MPPPFFHIIYSNNVPTSIWTITLQFPPNVLDIRENRRATHWINKLRNLFAAIHHPRNDSINDARTFYFKEHYQMANWIRNWLPQKWYLIFLVSNLKIQTHTIQCQVHWIQIPAARNPSPNFQTQNEPNLVKSLNDMLVSMLNDYHCVDTCVHVFVCMSCVF